MREKTCCFTGHRQIPAREVEEVKKRLETTVSSLYRRGVCCYGAGGALGFDTLAALTVLRLRAVHPDIKLILVLPCLTQAKNWSKADQIQYERIKAQANKVVYTSQEYFPGCMHRRNRHLVEHSGTCVCYLTRQSGGTAYTVDYARAQGLEIINVAG
ncbi:MAG: DUF1273 domain-containing protein [Lawsonibacter sp.]|nr:DUF1273 domain-containing protein [Lawsonibacter sp.]